MLIQQLMVLVCLLLLLQLVSLVSAVVSLLLVLLLLLSVQQVKTLRHSVSHLSSLLLAKVLLFTDFSFLSLSLTSSNSKLVNYKSQVS